MHAVDRVVPRHFAGGVVGALDLVAASCLQVARRALVPTRGERERHALELLAQLLARSGIAARLVRQVIPPAIDAVVHAVLLR